MESRFPASVGDLRYGILSAFNSLRVANFKAFGQSQHVPLRPLTLLFGANSAGKSSVLHALALAHHAVETGDLDPQRTRIGGDSIDLGGFGQYVHLGLSGGLQPELAFELTSDHLPGLALSFLHGSRSVTVELGVGRASAEAPEVKAAVRVERFTVNVDGRQMLSMNVRPNGTLRLDTLDHSHPVFRRGFGEIVALFTTTQEVRQEDFVVISETLDELVPEMAARSDRFFPRMEGESNGPPLEARGKLFAVSQGRRQADLARAVREVFPALLRELLDDLATALEAEIRRLDYLGPLRSYPPRFLAFSQQNDPNWHAGGGHAWDIVRVRDEVRERVNGWLGDARRLKTPYLLEVQDLIPAIALENELAPRLVGTLDFAETTLDELRGEYPNDSSVPESAGDLVDVKEEVLEWTSQVVAEGSGVLQNLVLIDQRSGTTVSHRDIGIGVSQVLPVLVTAFTGSGKLIAIEQPEIHLHPALQAELGDVFLESALGGAENRFLIETHSEHLILRILRRIRETTDGELPDGKTAVRPEDVAVLYIQPGPDGAEIIHLPITADGDFEHPWPDGFFDEREEELF